MAIKANAMQHIRDICLALPDTSEGVHYGEIVFMVGTEMFASAGAKKGPMRVTVQLEPEQCKALLAKDPRFEKYKYVPNGVTISASDIDDWEQIRALVAESYRITAAGPAREEKKKTTAQSRRD